MTFESETAYPKNKHVFGWLYCRVFDRVTLMWVDLTQRAQFFCSFWTMGSFAPVEVLVSGSYELTLKKTNVVQVGS